MKPIIILCSLLLVAELQSINLLTRVAAQNIDFEDRRIIIDFIDSFKRPEVLFVIHRNATRCQDLVRVVLDSSGGLGPGVGCNAQGRVTNLLLRSPINSNDVDQDPIGGTVIPRSLANLTSLVELRLVELGLRGTIPEEIFLLPNLTIFQVTVNRLWGSIPATVRNATKLTSLLMNSNLLTGMIPDLRPLNRLNFLRLDASNFECPQPFISPNVFNSINFPNMNRGGCSLTTNRLSSDGDPFSLCGFDLRTATAPLCSYFPVIYDNTTTNIHPTSVIIGPSESRVLLRLDRFRHAFFFPQDPTYSAFLLDSLSVSTFPALSRDRTNTHVFYPFRGYTSIVRDAANPNIWRLSAPLNGTRNILETIWEFKPPLEVKFSYLLRDWDWAAPDHNAVQLNLQTTVVTDLYRSNQTGAYCYSPEINDTAILTGSSPGPFIECKSGAKYVNVSISNFAILLNQSTTFGGIVIDFPLVYQYDTSRFDAFIVNSAASFLHPFGRTPSINYVNASDSPIPTYLALNGVSDPSMINQALIFFLGLEMRRFNDTLVYDPTITLSLAFGDQPPTADAASPETAQLVQAINYGIVFGVLFAAIALVAVVLVFFLVPSLRRAIQPFFGFKTSKPPTLDEGDAPETKSQRWVKAAPLAEPEDENPSR